MPASSPASAKLRRRLVRDLARRGAIRTDGVRAAFLAVPRETFLPAFAAREGLEAVYRDDAIPTKFDDAGFAISSSSQPAIMAEMLEQLSLEPGMRVLEIGAGTGYNAALLAELVGPRGSVTTIDVDPEIARNARAALRHGKHGVRVVVADGRDGFAQRAPYDRVIVTASSDTVPHAWFDQLTDGGLLEVPLRVSASGAQVIPTLRKTGRRFLSVAVVSGGFMPLRDGGDGSPPSPPPCLIAHDATGGRHREPLCQISGEALRTLRPAAKRRLLSIALESGRRRPLGVRADEEALRIYLTLSLPARRSVTFDPGWAIGLIGRDGASLAYVEMHTDGAERRIGSLVSHGDTGAERALLAAVRDWDELGRPGRERLQLAVDYREGRSRLRLSWRPSSKSPENGI